MNWDEVFNRLSKVAWKKGELTEDEYRELLLGGDVSDRMERLVEVLRIKKLEQLVKGAEFIESITQDDPRFLKAINKYSAISESLSYKPEILPVVDMRPTYLTVYAVMSEKLEQHGRVMKYEELRRLFPSLTGQQIRWGIWEFEEALQNPDMHIKKTEHNKPA